MVTEAEIARINDLYHKSQTPEGLTPEEKQEQMHLRGKYIASIKDNLAAQLESTTIVDENGKKHPVRKKPKMKIVGGQAAKKKKDD